MYVTDQTNTPVKDADVSFTTQDATGLKTYVLPKTDAAGFTSYRFDVGAFRPAQTVFVEVTATFNGVTEPIRLRFLPGSSRTGKQKRAHQNVLVSAFDVQRCVSLPSR